MSFEILCQLGDLQEEVLPGKRNHNSRELSLHFLLSLVSPISSFTFRLCHVPDHHKLTLLSTAYLLVVGRAVIICYIRQLNQYSSAPAASWSRTDCGEDNSRSNQQRISIWKFNTIRLNLFPSHIISRNRSWLILLHPGREGRAWDLDWLPIPPEITSRCVRVSWWTWIMIIINVCSGSTTTTVFCMPPYLFVWPEKLQSEQYNLPITYAQQESDWISGYYPSCSPRLLLASNQQRVLVIRFDGQLGRSCLCAPANLPIALCPRRRTALRWRDWMCNWDPIIGLRFSSKGFNLPPTSTYYYCPLVSGRYKKSPGNRFLCF